jgi:replicative superfamily II helicase
MVDFNSLRKRNQRTISVDPIEIFRRNPKPQGINDLYSSQFEVLTAWQNRRIQKDTIIKLHTGGGKTLVGLLIAQSILNEESGPVVYLAPTIQLVQQTISKAQEYGIKAVSYEKGKPLNDLFLNGKAVLIGTY